MDGIGVCLSITGYVTMFLSNAIYAIVFMFLPQACKTSTKVIPSLYIRIQVPIILKFHYLIKTLLRLNYMMLQEKLLKK